MRREGPTRRFVYIGVGDHAGDKASPWSRAPRSTSTTCPRAPVAKALAGAVLEARLPGLARDGGPACGTVKPLQPWTVLPAD